MKFSVFINRFWQYLKPHSTKFVITSLMMILSSLIQIAQPELLGRITDEVFLLDTTQREESLAIFYTFVLLGLFFLYSLSSFISTASNAFVSGHVVMRLRNEMFVKLQKLPKKYFDDRTTGKILSKLTFDVNQISTTASDLWIILIRDTISVIGLLIYLLYVNWQLSIAILFILPIIAFVLKIAGKRLKKLSAYTQNTMGSLTHTLDENISNQSLIKIYHAQEQETKKIKDLTNQLRQQSFKSSITDNLNSSMVYILIGLGLSSSIYVASIPLAMTAGEFISFFTAFGMLISPSKNLANLNKPLQSAMAAANSIFSLLDTQEEQNQSTTKMQDIKGDIEFKNISFAYQDSKPVLHNLNLTIKAGESVALVGETGSGKTTLSQLLCRFYKPQQGEITIDNQNIEHFDINSLRENIAFVDQKTALFNDTIFGNIAFGQIDNIDFETVKQASKIANAQDFINKLENKFNTQIGEDGAKLSGGQRQRLSIARAVTKNAPILILDEATSSLDSATERKVQEAINNIQKNRTTIIIAHRLSTVERCDKIIVLKQGVIIEQGSHSELLAQNGEYKKLYQSQF
ncbi:Lipid A export ATP-binding/permease protein MsbA [hydrothermal vent metagenome]|uniref:Lipid A export ATP-binding/permease protein MsbA n=1 Tax=hydrothermal vent metagenome TaxID=652676 RepID=A0A1W1CLE2_9ZZZZ